MFGLLTNLDACEQQLHSEQSQPKGILRVNLPFAYGQLYIMPMMGRFRSLYPDIQLEISLSDDYIDMVSHSIDIAIRSGQLQDSRLVARKLTPMDFAICASPDLLKRNKKITVNNIESFPWILYRFMHTGKVLPVYGIKGRGKQRQTYSIATPNPVLITTDGLSLTAACKWVLV